MAADLRFTQTRKTNLEIVTQEGDTVRLRLRSRVEVSAAGVASSNADGATSAAAATVISGSKFEISVEGNLNDEEIAAIRNVLTKVEALAGEFFRGDVQAAFAAAADLNIDADQLASVALDLSFKQRVRATGFFLQPPAAPTPEPAAPTALLPAFKPAPAESPAHAAVRGSGR